MGREISSKAAAAAASPLRDTRTRTEASLHLQHLQQAMQFPHRPIQPHPALQFYKVIPWAQTAVILRDRRSQNDCHLNAFLGKCPFQFSLT